MSITLGVEWFLEGCTANYLSILVARMPEVFQAFRVFKASSEQH